MDITKIRRHKFPQIPSLDVELDSIASALINLSGQRSDKLPLDNQAMELSRFIKKEGDRYKEYIKVDGKIVTLSGEGGGNKGDKGDKGDRGEPGIGIPSGGLTGQILKKNSNTDYDTVWGSELGLIGTKLVDETNIGHGKFPVFNASLNKYVLETQKIYSALPPITINEESIGLDYNTTNLRITNNALNTIQDIATTSTPTFNQIILNNASSNTLHAVRADRNIGTSFPLTGGGNLVSNLTLGLNINQTNLRITDNALNTIQDIDITSIPRFAGLHTTGNVGIGTLSPARRLEVVDSTDINNGEIARFAGSVAAVSIGYVGGSPSLWFQGNTNTRIRAIGGTALELISQASQFSDMLFRTRRNIVFQYFDGTNTVDRIWIGLVNGNVGINTSTLTEKLNIDGNFRQLGNSSLYNNYTSGWAGVGWRLDYGVTTSAKASFEIDDLTVRGTMRVFELIINQIRATNGSFFVTSSAKVEVVAVEGSTATILFEDPEGHGVCPFFVNDLIMIQRVRLDSTTIVKRIVMQVTSVSGRQITATILSQVGTITKNDLCVRIGNTTNVNRQGSIYLASDDSNAPYIDIVDGVNSWSAWGSHNKIKVRLGRLSGITHPVFGTIGSNVYGMYSKGNLYITSDDTTSNIVTLRTDNHAGLFLGINYNGANPLYISLGKIFTSKSLEYSNDYGFALRDESGNNFIELSTNRKHIAGWDFTQERFFKDTDIELNSATKSIGVNSNRVKMFYTNSSSWGVEGRDSSNNIIFQLGSTNKISGWNFDTTKLFNGVVSLEASSSMKGLVVDTDRIKVGLFDFGTMSNSYSNINTLVLNGYSAIHPNDTAWGIIGHYWVGNTQYPPGLYRYHNYLNSSINTNCSSWDYAITRRLFNHTSYLLGKTVRIKSKIYFTLGSEGLAYSGGKFTIAIRYYDNNFNTTYRRIIYETSISDDNQATQILDFTTNGFEVTLPEYIPNTAFVYIEYLFSGGGQSGTYYPYDMDISDFSFESYLNYKTWLNEKGLYMYNSPNNYIRIHDQISEINVPIIKIRDKKIVRFLGKLAVPPIDDVEIGDMYINSTNNKTFQCSGVTFDGEPIWAALN